MPRDYAKALYWCVQANKPFLADIFGYDIEATNKSCAINFAKEELSSSLNASTLDEYYKAKLIAGINWLKVAFETRDKSARQLLEIMEDMNKKMKATILMVTHDPLSASYCSKILFLKDGKIFNRIEKEKRI